jgi:hypothetical protein
MERGYGEGPKCDWGDDDASNEEAQMSNELLALLRHRVTTRYYDQPQVIDRIARAVLRLEQSQAFL